MINDIIRVACDKLSAINDITRFARDKAEYNIRIGRDLCVRLWQLHS